MILRDTDLYDSMEIRLVELLKKPDAFGLKQEESDYSKMVALMLAHRMLVSIAETLVDECTKLLDEGYLSSDLDLLHHRLLIAFKGTDKERLRSGDRAYHMASFKECIDDLVEPSPEEQEMDQQCLTTELWDETMDFFRQIQTFYEAKISF